MARYAERPIVFPLSNPTSRVEATPAELIAWTDGRALIATGSPFDVEYGGRRHPIAQCNNSYIFPGVGLGVLAVEIRRVSDAMFMAAARALADAAPAAKGDAVPRLLPPLSDVRAVSRHIAIKVALAAVADGLIPPTTEAEIAARVDATMWEPVYQPYVAADRGTGATPSAAAKVRL